MAYFGYLYRLLLGAWIGGILCFAAFFAPALFRLLGRDQAAAVVREIIPTFDGFALAAGAALMVVSVFAEGARGRSLIRLGLFAAMTALAAVSLFGVTPAIEALRAQVGGEISALEQRHPIRLAFGRLHTASTLLMLGQFVLGAIALGIPIWGSPPRRWFADRAAPVALAAPSPVRAFEERR
jgi:hypothetical protein